MTDFLNYLVMSYFLDNCVDDLSDVSPESEIIENPTESDIDFIDDGSITSGSENFRSFRKRSSENSGQNTREEFRDKRVCEFGGGQRSGGIEVISVEYIEHSQFPTFEDLVSDSTAEEFETFGNETFEEILEPLCQNEQEGNHSRINSGTGITNGNVSGIHPDDFYTIHPHSSANIGQSFVKHRSKGIISEDDFVCIESIGSSSTNSSKVSEITSIRYNKTNEERFAECLNGGHLTNLILKHGLLRKRIIHDILLKGDERASIAGIAKAMGYGYGGHICIISSHSDHLHVVHDCSWSNRQCRCARIRALNEEFRRISRTNVCCRQVTWKHWYNLTIYLHQHGRRIESMDLCGRTWIQLNQIRYVPSSTNTSYEAQKNQRILEGCEISKLLLNEECCRSESADGGQTSGIGDIKYNSTAGNQKGNKAESLLQFIRSIPTAPPSLIFQTLEWRNSKYKFYSESCPLLKTIMKLVNVEYASLTLREIYNLTVKADKVYYNTLDQSTYYDVSTSVYVLDELLKFQLGGEERDTTRWYVL